MLEGIQITRSRLTLNLLSVCAIFVYVTPVKPLESLAVISCEEFKRSTNSTWYKGRPAAPEQNNRLSDGLLCDVEASVFSAVCAFSRLIKGNDVDNDEAAAIRALWSPLWSL